MAFNIYVLSDFFMLISMTISFPHLGAHEKRTTGELINFLRRINKKYLLLLLGKVIEEDSTRKDLDEDDDYVYQRQLNNMEGVFEMYTYCLSALLNISVLRCNQPKLARRGLRTLLRTNTLLYKNHKDGNGVEKAILAMMAAIIQNIALHPENRTRSGCPSLALFLMPTQPNPQLMISCFVSNDLNCTDLTSHATLFFFKQGAIGTV